MTYSKITLSVCKYVRSGKSQKSFIHFDNNTHTQAYLSSTEAYDEISDGCVLSFS